MAAPKLRPSVENLTGAATDSNILAALAFVAVLAVAALILYNLRDEEPKCPVIPLKN